MASYFLKSVFASTLTSIGKILPENFNSRCGKSKILVDFCL